MVVASLGLWLAISENFEVLFMQISDRVFALQNCKVNHGDKSTVSNVFGSSSGLVS